MKSLPNLELHFRTTVKNVNLQETNFEVVKPDGSIEKK